MRTRVLLGLLVTWCCLACSGQVNVKLKGRMHAVDHGQERSTIVLVNGAGDTLHVRNTRSGRFSFRVAAGDSYALAFQQPGSITKEVVVDTRGVQLQRLCRKNKRVEFDVMMVGGDSQVRLRYVRPVGSITLVPESGRLLVERDRAFELVEEEGPVQQN
jgi:hypothetical protein